MPSILTSADSFLARYDVVLCDVWGVVYDGLGAIPPAAAALARFRGQGGTVAMISNSPARSDEVAAMLDSAGVDRAAYDLIVTSGDMTHERLREAGAAKVYHTGSDRDLGIFEGLPLTLTGIEDADLIVATELRDYFTETPEDYRAVLTRGAARGLPFVCANPDLVVHVGERLLPCAGALAEMYEDLGGSVFWAGKPHPPIYERALALANARRAMPAAKSAVLAIGDSMRTDMAGAHGVGVDGLFIAGGIHRDELGDHAAIDAAQILDLAGHLSQTVVAVMGGLR